MERANRVLAAAWRSGVLPRPVLEASPLEAAALRFSRSRDFGDEAGWRQPFERLLHSLREEADLNPLGLAMAHGQIVKALRERLRNQALWRAHPEILDRPMPAPIIILGQMRSGTTRLQRLLACDRRLSHTRLYESLIPAPIFAGTLLPDLRRLGAGALLAVMRVLNPELGRIHPTGIGEPDEEFGHFSFSFGSAQFEAQWRVPAFARWWKEADRSWLYREFKALLQTNAWRRGDPADKPVLLKAPQFMQDLPAVLEAFPGARLVCLDRDLAEIVPSSASLVWHQMRIQSDTADPAWIGREWLRKTLLRRDVAEATRRARPDVPQIEVDYEAMNRDWRGEIERIYDFLDLKLTPELLARMTAYVETARGHLGHRYSLEQFGLSPADFPSPPRHSRESGKRKFAEGNPASFSAAPGKAAGSPLSRG